MSTIIGQYNVGGLQGVGTVKTMEPGKQTVNETKATTSSPSNEFSGPTINGIQCPSYDQYLAMTPAEKTSFFDMLTREERAQYLSYCRETEMEAELEKARQGIKDGIDQALAPFVKQIQEQIDEAIRAKIDGQ